MADATSNPAPDALVAVSRAATTARLLSGLVHEINNALLVISGTVEVLGGRTDLHESVVRGLERIRRQTERTAASIAQVTAFTRAPLDTRGEVDLAELARLAVDLRRFAAARTGLTLECSAGAPVTAAGNRGQLQQAILNLIVAAEQGVAGTAGRIAVDVETRGSWAHVRVTDSRPAAPTDRSDAVFEPFAAGRTPTDISGLSLFAAREIAVAHGGSLAFDEAAATVSIVLRLPSPPRLVDRID